jgi:cytidylate kinase
MAVITISRQFGSGGNLIAEHICELTGYQRFDKHVITKVAAEAGFSHEEIVDYSEDNHKVQTFLDRLLGRSQPVAQMHVWRESADGVRVTEEITVNEEHALELTRMAIEAAYQLNNFVIMGRGGQVLLKDRPRVLHVRIEAPLEDRILNVRREPALVGKAFGLSYEDRRAAQDLIEASDAASADYMRRFHHVAWDELGLYHIIINSAQLSIDQAARTIIQMAEVLEQEKELA